MRRGAVPWTIVRATQFFTFPVPFLDAAKAGIAAVPDMRCQPVSVEAVARLIVSVLESPAPGTVVDIAGPRESNTVTRAPGLASTHSRSGRTRHPRRWAAPRSARPHR